MTENTPQELSDREREILVLLATGATNKEIAQSLYISPNTVKVHLRNIFGKIGVSSRTEAAMYAVKLGMVMPSEAAPPQAPISTSQFAPHPQETQTTFAVETEISAVGDVSQQSSSAEPSETLIARSALQHSTRRGWLAVGGWLFTFVLLVTIGIVTLANYTPQVTRIEDQYIPSAAQMAVTRWQTHPALSIPRQNFALIGYGGQLYAFGGQNTTQTLATAETYLPQQDRWQPIASLPIAVSHVQAAVLNGKIYLPGGLLASSQPTTTVQVYIPPANTWQTVQPMPHAIHSYAITAFEGNLYLFGGTDGQKTLTIALRYTPEDGWQPLPNMPTARSGAYAINVNNRIFIIGGQTDNTLAPTIEIFDPNDLASPWQTPLPLPETQGDLLGTAAFADMVYIFSQTASSDALQILLYTPQNARWQMTTETTAFATQPALAPLGVYVYFCNGNQTMSYQAIFSIAIPLVH